MGLRIGTNIAALSASRFINQAEKKVSHSVRALASGSRIVSIGDDAAGYAIAENLRGQTASLRQAKRNTDMGTSLIQVAEGGLNEQNNILIRLRELAVQGASDTVSDEEREFLEVEFKQLVNEFDRIAQTTTYGTKKLLTGTDDEFKMHVGAGNTDNDVITYKFDADTRAGAVGIDDLSVSSQDDAGSTLTELDSALFKIIKARASFGAIQSRLDHAANHLEVQAENIEAARSRIVDADVAREVANLTQAQIQSQFAVAALTNANQTTASAIKLLG